jgi:Holliday junction DNA helicase RuvA
VALAVLSGIEPNELVRAIRGGDVGRLTRIPGIGRKTAERMVLELKDRMPEGAEPHADDAVPDGADVRADVLSALANLGYQAPLVERAVDRVLKDAADRSFEFVLRQVLREMAR